MNKPASIIIKETKDKMISIINESTLPLCVIEMIINDIHNQCIIASKEEYEKDKNKYEKSLEVKEEKEDGV